ncbi:hypothetical protein C8J57DRAFT_1573341 [Mycena rebaudengoi]|nr:hypothetical protein C8J57DRAFT_1573341 [Mycena rebaudengoi]
MYSCKCGMSSNPGVKCLFDPFKRCLNRILNGPDPRTARIKLHKTRSIINETGKSRPKKTHPMEALRDIPGFSLALSLALLLDWILSAREAPTGPQVRTSVRDKPKYKSKDESKGVDFKNYNTIRCTKAKDVGSVQGQRERGGRHSVRKTAPVTCGERRQRLVARRREDGKWCVP